MAGTLDAQTLLGCCHSSRWVDAMLATQPFDDVFAASERAFDTLTDDDWREAFAGHARIGDRAGADERGKAEQAGAASATADEEQALREGNVAYEERFGHVFLICATGLDAGTMLAALRERIGNSPEVELANAAAEQRKITRLRLAAL